MQVQIFRVNPFETNCLVCHDEGEAVLIDPGTYTEEERSAVSSYLSEHGLVLRHLLLTHGHLDHIFGLAHFAESFSMGYAMHEADLPLIEEAELQASMFGVDIRTPPAPSRLLSEGETISFGRARWEIFCTPGHSPGSISFVDQSNRAVIAGDVLLQGSIGRTDLWAGSMQVLMNSIQTVLLRLPDDFVVYPGHGPTTTIGRERESNPFLAEIRKGA